MTDCVIEIQERVVPAKRGEGEALVRQKLLVQKKGDYFDKAAYERVAAFTLKQENKFEAHNAVTLVREGVSLDSTHNATLKQKLLYNKEKKLLKKIEDMLSDQPQAPDLVAPAYNRTRVKIPDIVYFEEKVAEQQDKLFTIIAETYALAVNKLMASGEATDDKSTYERARPHADRVFRLNDKGQFNNYIMLFFVSEQLAQLFCAELATRRFNRSELRAEVLPNNPAL